MQMGNPVERVGAGIEQSPGGAWQSDAVETVLCCVLAPRRDIHDATGVPVGLISSNWEEPRFKCGSH